MGIDRIDVLYLHGPKLRDLTEDVLACFAELKQAGKIRACGANTFDDDVINHIIETSCLDVVMLDYNVVKQNREPQIKALYENGIGVVAGQAQAEGLFLPDLFKIRGKKDLWYLARTFGRKSSRKLFFESRRLSFMNKLNGYDGSQVALKYVTDNPCVSSAAVGTCSFEHLQKNVDAMAVEIPEEIKERIRKAVTKKTTLPFFAQIMPPQKSPGGRPGRTDLRRGGLHPQRFRARRGVLPHRRRRVRRHIRDGKRRSRQGARQAEEGFVSMAR